MTTKEKFEQIQKERPESRIWQRSREEQEVRDKLAQVLLQQRRIDKLKKEKESTFPKIEEFCEKYCLDKIVDANLSDDELQFVKHWFSDYDFGWVVDWWNVLYEELEDETKDYLSGEKKWVDYLYNHFKGAAKTAFIELSEKLISWLNTLPEDDKLICSYYLAKQGVIICWRDSMETWFDYWFYYTDMESDRCDYTEMTLKKLWFDKYVKYVWDSCYRIREEEVLQPIIDKKQKDVVWSIKKEMSDLDQEYTKLDVHKKELELKKQEFETRREAIKKYWEPVEKALDILSWEKSIERKKAIKKDKQHDTYAILSEYSRDSWSGGMEYWVVVSVKRGSNTKAISIKYRDPYDYRNDDWSKCYSKINDIKVEWDKVFVTVSSSKRAETYKFDLPEWLDDIKLLDTEAQKVFQARIDQEIQRLVQENTKDLTYPNTYDFWLRLASWWLLSQSCDVKYDKASVINKKIDLLKWEAYIEIKAQTDACGSEGKEYAIIKYLISPTQTKEVNREYMRQGGMHSIMSFIY